MNRKWHAFFAGMGLVFTMIDISKADWTSAILSFILLIGNAMFAIFADRE